jgi:hypothetical protein
MMFDEYLIVRQQRLMTIAYPGENGIKSALSALPVFSLLP